ncbi:phosphatase 2C-like domain-containing protein [Scenedesmus sp. NREL 46B-D3]|nr:phosphatase 2C-like domain-containing protein [Scenedesmus sp. NREL 46B-D3]
MTTAAAGQQQGSQGDRMSVEDALLLMQQAVRKGQLQEAAAIGATAAVPLSIRLENLSLLGEIASGAEATVLYATLNSSSSSSSDATPPAGTPTHGSSSDVAVKRFKMHHSDDLNRFRRELRILASLAGHPNIVPLLGARALPPDYLMVMPLAATTLHGKLYQLGWRPSHVELLHLALQAAEGLAAVHAKGVVHRDVKPNNMLLSYEGQLWLADFGLAASVEEVVQESTLSVGLLRSRGKPTGGFLKRAMAGTLEYMAPEVLLKRPASQASDVYALAITINELAAGVFPFSDCTKDNPEIHTVLEHGYGRQELATAVAAEGLRPSLPKQAPAGLTALLQAAWSLDPAARPTAAQLRDALAALLQQAQQQQACGAAEQQQQRVVVDACCDASSEEGLSAMEVDATSAAAAAAAAFKQRQQRQQDSDCSGACSSAGSDVFIPEDSDTLASSTLSLLPHGQQQQQRLRRIPRSSSASTLGSGPDTGPGFAAAGDSSSSHGSKPLSTEAANAAAAAAAAAAVPAAASLQGVLSLTAAAAAAAAAAGVVESGAFGALGPRESMEDRHVVVQGLGGDARVTLAAVFDGHRGHEAAAYAAAQLPRNLLLASVLEGSSSSGEHAAAQSAGSEQPAADDCSGAAVALKRAFLATDAAFWQEWQAEMHAHAAAGQYTERYPGCTALAAVLAGPQLLVANAGDGRAVLSRGGTAVPLSRQHTADLVDERERVVAAGGTVAFRGGSWRVGTAALQVTRALGDFDLKVPRQQPSQQQQQRCSPYSCNPLSASSASSSSGSMPVTAEPEVVSVRLSGADQFLILGTDGLWDVVGDQEAVGLVHDTVKDPFLCAKRLVMEALSRGSSDNVSAVVLFLQPKHTLERVWVRGGGAAVPAATATFYGSRRLTTQQAAEQAGDGAAAAAAGAAGAADEMMDTY